jgi:HEAT repeat protein
MNIASDGFTWAFLFFSALGNSHVREIAAQLGEDVRLLQSAKLATDGPGLVKHFRRYVPSEDDRKQIEALAEKLGEASFAVRERATTELIRHGPAALPALRRQMKDGPLETQIRAKRCVDVIELGHSAPATAAALRVLAIARPDGACAALLGFAPACGDELVEEELLRALGWLGVKDGKIDPAILAALKDSETARRGAAALVAGRHGTPQQRQEAQVLLNDPRLTVRLRAAQGLIAAGDASAIPALLAILSEGTMEQARDAEDLLHHVAGKSAPTVSLDMGNRSKCHEAWQDWLKSHKGPITLARIDPMETSSTRSREVVARMVQGLLKKDVSLLRQTTDVPFHVLGQKVYLTRQEFEEMIDEPLPPEIKLKVGKVVGTADFLKDLAKGSGLFPGGKDQKSATDFAKQHQRTSRIVYVHFDLGQQAPELQVTVAFFVRSGGMRARVFAVAPLATGKGQ